MTATIPLGEAFEFIRNGMNIKQSKDAGGVPITRIETISDGTIDLKRVGYAGLQSEGNEKWILEKGDLLLSHINSVEHIGKCALFEGEGAPLIHGMNLLNMRPKQSMIYPRYAMWALKEPGFKNRILRFVNKAVNQASISTTNLKTVEIPLPPLNEQKRIAAILDQADGLRRLRQRAIDHHNTLGQAIFYDMFGDPFSASLSNQTTELSELTTRITYGFTSPMSHHEEGIPIVTAKNVRDGYIDYSTCKFAIQSEVDKLTDKSKPERGDILITKDGTIGRYSVFDDDFPICINQSVALIKPDHDRVISAYLAAYIGSDGVQARFQGMKKGNALPHLQITELAKFPVLCPPIDDQLSFSEKLKSLSGAKSLQEVSLESADELFASLQHRAFRGEL